MRVYAVERDCIDPYFEPHTVMIFSTEEKAIAFIEAQADKEMLNICEWDLDTETQKVD